MKRKPLTLLERAVSEAAISQKPGFCRRDPGEIEPECILGCGVEGGQKGQKGTDIFAERKATYMPINRAEIIEEIEAHMRRFGGAPSEWWAGTAKDARGPFFQRHHEADLGDGRVNSFRLQMP